MTDTSAVIQSLPTRQRARTLAVNPVRSSGWPSNVSDPKVDLPHWLRFASRRGTIGSMQFHLDGFKHCSGLVTENTVGSLSLGIGMISRWERHDEGEARGEQKGRTPRALLDS